MAVTKTSDEEEKLTLDITNGDLKAINEIRKTWKFKKVEDIIRFGLAVMIQSKDKVVTIRAEGKETKLSPAKELLEEE